ncbi:hypothetical protein [Methanocalculus sp. MSAO_Arc2]|uniref:hypothetical protein n=1 Tax=Methanocalculus sp. MSAO_Arc2 TaxID=2293855 RepID=UPI0026CCD0C9
MVAEKVKRWTAELKAEGKVEGKIEGKVEERRTILRRMKVFGMSISEISEIT